MALRPGGRVAVAATVAIALVQLTGCGDAPGGAGPVRPSPASRPTCKAFALSLVSDRGGQPTPREAAEWFSVHGGVDGQLPRSGWREAARDSTGVTLASDGSTLHAIQGSDTTWQVDSGSRC